MMRGLAIIGTVHLAITAGAVVVFVHYVRHPKLNADTCASLAARNLGVPSELYL